MLGSFGLGANCTEGGGFQAIAPGGFDAGGSHGGAGGRGRGPVEDSGHGEVFPKQPIFPIITLKREKPPWRWG